MRLLGNVLPPSFLAGATAVFVIFPIAVAATAMAGSLLPALRASRLDPLIAMRRD